MKLLSSALVAASLHAVACSSAPASPPGTGESTAPSTEPVIACSLGTTRCHGECVDLQTSNKDCGGCGLACSTTCTAGECVVTVAKPVAPIGAIAANATNVYWTAGPSCTEVGEDTVESAPVTGGAITTIASGYCFTSGIALGSTAVYWPGVLHDRTPHYHPSLLSAPLEGGVATRMAKTVFSSSNFALGDERLFWGDSSDGITVKSVTLEGRDVTTVAPSPEGVEGITTYGDQVYWGEGYGGEAAVVTAPTSGGAPVTLGSGVFAVQTPAADADNVYWIDGIAGRVVSMPISGGPLTTIWAGTSTRGPSALALVGTSLYWTVSSSTPDGGAIVRATTDGQSVVTLVSGLSAPRGLAISGQSVVFVDIGTDVVGSVTPR